MDVQQSKVVSNTPVKQPLMFSKGFMFFALSATWGYLAGKWVNALYYEPYNIQNKQKRAEQDLNELIKSIEIDPLNVTFDDVCSMRQIFEGPDLHHDKRIENWDKYNNAYDAYLKAHKLGKYHPTHQS